MCAEDFEVCHDTEFGEYIKMTTSIKSKNHQGSIGTSDSVSDGRIVNPAHVKAFKLLVSKLPTSSSGRTRLFQQVKKKATTEAQIWYNGKPVGKNTLGGLMRILSVKCSLSQRNTNHSVRASTITEMCRQSVSPSTIMGVSGHKCQQSLTHYNRPSGCDKLKAASLLDGPSSASTTDLHPELAGIDLDLLFQPPMYSEPVAAQAVQPDECLDIDALISSCSAEELNKLETQQGASVFQACSYSSCTITNHITINVVKK
eukprot:scpid76013/ scgid11518/ 